MDKIIAKRNDIAFYIKLFPLSFHKQAYWKAKSVVCKKSLPLLEDCYAGKEIEKTDCNTREVDETIRLAESLDITAVPSIILPDGRLRMGVMSESDLTNLIDGKI
jgi:protein-disulfide isomerase